MAKKSKEVIEVKISALVPDDKNFNKHSAYGTALLEKSLSRFGAGRSILIDKNNRIIAGNATIDGASALGMDDIQIVESDGTKIVAVKRTDIDLDTKVGREMALADNAAAKANIVLDAELIIAELSEITAEEWGIEKGEGEYEIEEDEYEVNEGGLTTDIEPGDLFEIGPHRLLCGDSTSPEQVAKMMGGQLADMVMTDPPYNVNYEGGTGMKIMNDNMTDASFYKFLLDFYGTYAAQTKAGGAWYVWHGDQGGEIFRRAMKESGILMKQCLVWVKNALVMGRQDYHWKHEPCLYGWKEGAGHYFTEERNHSTVIEDKIDIGKLTKEQMKQMLTEILSEKNKTSVIHCDKPSRNDLHPTMKPIKLIAPLIKNSSREGEIVVDGFLGSGSTMVASHQIKRKCYGMEMDTKYCQVIVDRMQALEPGIKILRNGKPYTGNTMAAGSGDQEQVTVQKEKTPQVKKKAKEKGKGNK